MTTKTTTITARVMRGTVPDPGGPERVATIDGLGSFELSPDDRRLVGAEWDAFGWTTIEIDRDEALSLIRSADEAVRSAIARDRGGADRQLAAMERQSEGE